MTEFKEMKTVVEDIEPLELAADEDVEQQQEPHNKERLQQKTGEWIHFTFLITIRWNIILFSIHWQNSHKIHIFFIIRIVINYLNNLFVHRNNI